MAKSIETLKIKAELWLKKQLQQKNFVFKKSDLDKSIRDYLSQEQVLAELNYQYVFIKANTETLSGAFINNLWVLIFQFCDQAFDKDWYITGSYSYRFMIDNFSCPEKQISISTKKKTNTIIQLPAGLSILASYDKDYKDKPVNRKPFLEAELKVLKQEYIVLNSTENEYRLY